jgi:ubiquinone/menaquinone biosynthesis C-methylase UbiE
MKNSQEEKKIIKANIAYHEVLSETYDREQPHFKSENIKQVEDNLRALISITGDEAIVDLGCGTGFIINIAKRLFKRVVGVDITQKMLDLVDKTGGNIELYNALSSDTGLPSNQFDVCTAYGFLHHLKDVRPTFQEAYHLLRKGGIFYADLEPNYYYWSMIKDIQNSRVDNDIIGREISSIKDIASEISGRFDIAEETVALAEYQKIVKGGFREDEIVYMLKDSGFDTVEYRYEWYLGQAHYIHSDPNNGVIIESYLRNFLPATRCLFKYVSFRARK